MDDPLVSIVVITYNSSTYIEETLDSTLGQNYPNLELIISDDCSTDNTVEICRNWLEKHGKEFKRTKLVVAPVNRGVAPNCNQGIREANGEWIKGLSGDDKFLPNTIRDYVDYVKENPEAKIVFGEFSFYGVNQTLVKKAKSSYEEKLYPLIKKEQRKQYKNILKHMFVPGPGLFYKKSLWKEIGEFDENYPMAEEYPFIFEILRRGNRIYFLDKEVYGYNIREQSLCREKEGLRKHNKDRYRHFKEVRLKYMGKNLQFWDIYGEYTYFLFMLYSGKSKLLKFLYKLMFYSFFPRLIQKFSEYRNIDL